MSWVDDNKGQGPWEFTEQSDKLHYNEGNLISDHDNPVWATDHLSFSDEPITPTHHPWCGYWHKGYGPLECNCAGITIGYTTLGMSTGEEQVLTVQNSVGGCTYNWEIVSGGGSLSSNTGMSIVYTAPSSNPNCIYNPTIELSCGDVCDSITIAANDYAGTAWAYKIWQECVPHGVEGRYYKLMDGYSCDGVHQFGPNYSCSGTDEANCIAVCPPIGVEDVRTQVMKDGGCCPEALL